MKVLTWDESLSVQIQEVDEDHQKLVNLFNLLNLAVEEGDAPHYIEAIMAELVACTVWHFRHEERLMLKYAYNGFLEHKTEHQELIESASELQQKLLQKGNPPSSKDIEFLEHWLIGHILGADMEMGAYLGEVM